MADQRETRAVTSVTGADARGAFPPEGPPHWDALLISIGVYITVIIGRIHQLIPALEGLKPGVLTGGIMIVLFLSRRPVSQNWTRLDRGWRFLIVALTLWPMFTIPLSLYAGLSFTFWREAILQSGGLALIVAMSIRGVEDVRRLAGVFVVCIAFYSVMILKAFGANLNVRFEGLYSYDTNDFAHVVVCALPLAVYFALSSSRFVVKCCFSLITLLYLIIIIKSGSRGGFLGLVAVGVSALLAWRAVSLPRRLGALLAAAAFLSIFASGMFLSRIASLGDATTDYNVTDEGGRIQAWKRGIRYMTDNPVLGVGAGAFGVAEGTISDLAIRANAQGRLNVKWMAPHNSFVEIGAETGIPGFLLFIYLAGHLLRRSYWLGAGRLQGTSRRHMLLGGALFLSLVGFYVTAFFLSQAYSSVLYLLAGLLCPLLGGRNVGSGVPQSPPARSR